MFPAALSEKVKQVEKNAQSQIEREIEKASDIVKDSLHQQNNIISQVKKLILLAL